MLPVIRQFLEDHKITEIDRRFAAYAPYPSEWLYYKFVRTHISDEHCYPFFKKMNTAMSMFACGRICDSKKEYNEAIKYYKLYCEMGNPDNDGHYYIAESYDKLGNEDERLKYLTLGAESGYARAATILAKKYERNCTPNLHKSRYYYKLSGDHASQTRVEQKLLVQFAIQLNKQDYLLAYELMQIHNWPNKKHVKILIENEYFDALGFTTLSPCGLIKDLCNIVVSYLI